MKGSFAEKALAQVLKKETDEATELAKELRIMETHAQKYDQYQQFSPGFRFLESLINWLHQFERGEEARVAFDFIKNRLIFISEDQIRLLVESVYNRFIRAYILEQISIEKSLPAHKLVKASNMPQFKESIQRSVFLGLSDGARTDVFRRANPHIQNDQVCLTYSISEKNLDDFSKHLSLQKASKQTFKYIWLMDDFSASGTTFIRKNKDSGDWAGKIPQTVEMLLKLKDKEYFDPTVRIRIILYIAYYKAKEHFDKCIQEYWDENKSKLDGLPLPELSIAQLLDESVCLDEKHLKDKAILKLIQSDKYYDHTVFNDASEVGKTEDLKLGYAAGALPLVLAHNTPNNSVSILWSFEDAGFVGLFPRVSRH
jgi:hypothetical protein